MVCNYLLCSKIRQDHISMLSIESWGWFVGKDKDKEGKLR